MERLLLGTGILVAAGGCLGAWLAARAAAQVRQMQAAVALVRHLREQIAVFSRPVRECLAGLPQEIASVLGVVAGEEASDLEEFLARCETLPDGAREDLKGLARSLGRGYRDEQIRLCDGVLGRLAEQEERLVRALPGRQRSDRVLGVCGALVLAILLL